MRRFLVVGCGGSGGATLAFIMDQLRSELHSAGIEKLLGGWQFVQIDVPSAPETGPEGLANVPEPATWLLLVFVLPLAMMMVRR